MIESIMEMIDRVESDAQQRYVHPMAMSAEDSLPGRYQAAEYTIGVLARYIAVLKVRNARLESRLYLAQKQRAGGDT